MDTEAYIGSGNLEAYALGALSPEERLSVEAGIARHPELAAALAAIEVMEEEALTANARRIGEIITQHFEQAQQDDPRIGDIRGRGAMMAVELVDPKTKAPLADAVNHVAIEARKQGVITLTAGTYGNVLRFLPPVVIGEDLLTEGLGVITDILAQTRNVAHSEVNA